MSSYPRNADQGMFGISVVAELSGASIQAIRGYENKGLVEPSRTAGGTRRYSPNDVERIGQIIALATEGVNLAGIGQILALRAETAQLRHELNNNTGNTNRETHDDDDADAEES